MFQDLQAPEGTLHPILQVDAIRFLSTFRNQVRLFSRDCWPRTYLIQNYDVVDEGRITDGPTSPCSASALQQLCSVHIRGSRDRTYPLHQEWKYSPVGVIIALALENLPSDVLLYSSFQPEDIQPFSGELIDTVLNKLESAGNPEKVAENDFMMKCKEFLWLFSWTCYSWTR